MGRELTCCSISTAILVLAGLALVVGVGSPYWYSIESDVEGFSLTTSFGLIWGCVEVGSEVECGRYDISNMTDWWKGAMALVLVAMGLGFMALLTAMFPPVSSCLQMVAGLCGVGGSAWFVIEIDDLYGDSTAELAGFDTSWSWGFFLAVIGGGLMFLNGIGMAILACSSGCSMSPLACCCGDRRNRV